ncbi:MAG: glycosyltransferase [Lachnospiraceae bacterium]|nr:glycosyltransferase [Lachnospiraceae bacterium]
MTERVADIIILTYKPDKELFDHLDMLKKQTVKPGKIILMNTGEPYLSRLLSGTDYAGRYPGLEIHHVSEMEFNHGKTRNQAASHSEAPFLVFMTQDAGPADGHLLEELLKPFEDQTVSVSYARQLPREDCSASERYNRIFNYPDEERSKGQEDLAELGIKTFFCSNVCACYRRSDFDAAGGFVDSTIFNEDMIYAAGQVRAGKKIYYAAKARVRHSHDYSAKKQFKRNFDLGVSQADHPEIFSGVSSVGEGKKLVRGCVVYLFSRGKLLEIPGYLVKCAARYLGYRRGLNYRKLKREKILRFTASPNYWLRLWDAESEKGALKEYEKR